MALKAKLATLAGLDTATTGLYKKQGEFFVLDVEGVDGFELEDVTNLRSTNGKLRDEVGELKKAAKPFEGLDPKKVARVMAKADEIEAWKPDAATEEIVTRRTKDIRENYERDSAAKDKTNADLRAENDGLLIGFELESAFKAHGAFEDRARPSVLPRIRVERAEGKKPAVYVVDMEGRHITSKKPGSADRMGVDEFVSTLKQDKNNGWMFKGSGASGTGASGSAGGSVTNAKVVSRSEAGKYLKELATGEAVIQD